MKRKIRRHDLHEGVGRHEMADPCDQEKGRENALAMANFKIFMKAITFSTAATSDASPTIAMPFSTLDHADSAGWRPRSGGHP